MLQRRKKLACLCITTALLAATATMSVEASEVKSQAVSQTEVTVEETTKKTEKKAAKKAKKAAQKEAEKEASSKQETQQKDNTEEKQKNKNKKKNKKQNTKKSKKNKKKIAIAQVTSYINVRSQPSTDGEILGKLHNNSVGEVIGQEGDWLKIKSGTVEGYIKAEYALTGKAGKQKAKEVGQRKAKVKATTLRIRKEATTESSTVGLLPKAEVLNVEEEVKGWVKVNSSEGNGYLSKKHVKVYTVNTVAESKEEEAARLAAEAEAARQAEEARRAEEARKNAAAKPSSSSNSSSNNSSSNNSTSNSSSSGSSSTGSTGSSSSASTGNTSDIGTRIANYALQFVGNPYVYGGTSLTNGADCSGFVMSVYKHFGINLPRTSGEQGKCGTNIGTSVSKAKPGDLVHYPGHIGIYIGNGKIVHASTAKTGIKVSNATYRTISSIRRIV